MNPDKKYELVAEDTIEVFGVKLFRIRATRTFNTWFGEVKEGELGGYVRSEENLSHDGKAWVGGEAWVGGKARVDGEAWVGGKARVGGEARVGGKARVGGEAWVDGKAWVGGWEWSEPFPGVRVPVPTPAPDGDAPEVEDTREPTENPEPDPLVALGEQLKQIGDELVVRGAK